MVCVEYVPPIDLCLECYSSRAELGQHKHTMGTDSWIMVTFHLSVMIGLQRKMVQLLDGLKQFGHGNWNDVSRYVRANCWL